jgi:FkbM family methyltransferase
MKALFYPDVPFNSLFIPYIYKEIYLENIYGDVTNQQKDLTIVDVGANIGCVTQYLRDFAKVVYSIEPSTEHYEALEKNVTYNKWTNVKPFKLALADKDGEMTLNLNPWNRTCHSLTQEYGEGSEKVKTMTFASFMKENKIDKIDLCKFDTEGAEDMILRSEGFTTVADKIKNIIVEFHFPTWQELVKHMINLGYEARRYNSSAIVVHFYRP